METGPTQRLSSIEMREKRCHSQHSHARKCQRFRELDVVEIENLAFQKLVVQNDPLYSKQDSLARASFFPTSHMPAELKYILHENQEFQKSMLVS